MTSKQDEMEKAAVELLAYFKSVNWSVQKDLWEFQAKLARVKYSAYQKEGFKHEDILYMIANGQK